MCVCMWVTFCYAKLCLKMQKRNENVLTWRLVSQDRKRNLPEKWTVEKHTVAVIWRWKCLETMQSTSMATTSIKTRVSLFSAAIVSVSETTFLCSMHLHDPITYRCEFASHRMRSGNCFLVDFTISLAGCKRRTAHNHNNGAIETIRSFSF